MSESTVTVKANQATTDWQDGAVFSVERTDYIDKLLANGILSEHVADDAPLYAGDGVVLAERYDPDAAPMTDDDAKAAGFDLDNPDDLPPADSKAESELNADEQKPATRRTRAKKSDDVGE